MVNNWLYRNNKKHTLINTCIKDAFKKTHFVSLSNDFATSEALKKHKKILSANIFLQILVCK